MNTVVQAQQGTHESRTGSQGRAIANQNGGTPTEGNQVHRLKVTHAPQLSQKTVTKKS
jgi:hypothetical protein